MCEWLTDAVIKPRYDDLKLIIIGLNPEDEKQAVDIRTSRTSKWITRNEARVEEGREAMGDPEDPQNPWNLPADAPVANQMMQFSQMQQQEQEQEQGYDDDEEDYQKSLRKSQPETKFLRIKID